MRVFSPGWNLSPLLQSFLCKTKFAITRENSSPPSARRAGISSQIGDESCHVTAIFPDRVENKVVYSAGNNRLARILKL